MRSIRMLFSKRFADERPWMPQRELLEGQIYHDNDISDFIIDAAIECGAAEMVESGISGKIIEPETKEKKLKKRESKCA